jgi:hypothetical protein
VEVELEMAKYFAAMMALTGATLLGRPGPAADEGSVTVCMEPDPHVMMGVRPLASAMFASIGVKIDWREPESCPVGVGAIRLRMSYESPIITKFKTMAYARPYEGAIVVFPNRVQELNPNGCPCVMAHVLVHEIAHVLEGMARHSRTGIMKARWDDGDYFEMRRKPLPFAREDVDLIHQGMWASRVVPVVLSRAVVEGR